MVVKIKGGVSNHVAITLRSIWLVVGLIVHTIEAEFQE